MRSYASGIALLAACCCVLAAGCRNGRQMQSDLVQRELRLQEDEIYRLEDHLAEYQSILSDTRCELEETKRQLADAKGGAQSSTSGAPMVAPSTAGPALAAPAARESAKPSPAAEKSVVELPEVEFVDPPAPKTPAAAKAAPQSGAVFEPGEPPRFEPPSSAPASAVPQSEAPLFDSPESSAAPLEPDPIDESGLPQSASEPYRPYPMAEPAPLVLASAVDARPIEDARRTPPDSVPTTLGPTLEVTHHPGPGVAAGSLTVNVLSTASVGARFSGPVSVLLAESANPQAKQPSGADRRIARWDFTPAEVAAARSVRAPDQLSLTVALPDTLPRSANTRVWVRLARRGGAATVVGVPVRFDASPSGALRSVSSAQKKAAWRGARLRDAAVELVSSEND
ncbi:MAG: hypothetical protein ACRCT8_02365 [Lacipirellulaceae bacterium]